MIESITTKTRPALLFANEFGKVLFVDENFVEMMNYTQSGVIVGEPIHIAMKLDYEIVRVLLEELSQAGQVREYPLELGAQSPINILCSALANYDPDGSLIGMDFTLQKVDQSVFAESSALALEKEPIVEVEPNKELLDLQRYFTVQIEAFQQLLLQWVGRKYSDNLTRIINETAEHNHWTIVLSMDGVHVEPENVNQDAYFALLAKGMAYTTRIVGAGEVARQIRKINKQIPLAMVEHPSIMKIHTMLRIAL